MRALYDVNVLLALFDTAHVHHAMARAWQRDNSAAGWASCPLTQNGFLRILSGPGYPRAIPLPDALAALQTQLELPGHEFWPDRLSIADRRVFDHARFLGPKQITDIYLLGLAVANGGRLVTFDRAITTSAVRGARPEHLVVLG